MIGDEMAEWGFFIWGIFIGFMGGFLCSMHMMLVFFKRCSEIHQQNLPNVEDYKFDDDGFPKHNDK